MKATLPHPEHESYLRHRRQMLRQIILPIALSTLAMIALIIWIGFVTFNQNGDVGRWAAISTIWIIIPLLLAGLILLAILVGLIYLMALALGALPRYTGLAQDYVQLARAYIIRGADMVADPIIAIDGYIENIKEFFARMNKS